MDLLDRLTRRRLVSATDGVIKDDNLLDAGDLLTESLLYFLIVSFPDSLVVCKLLLFCWRFEDGETGCVGVEVCFLSADVLDLTLVVDQSERVSGAINFAPRLLEGLGRDRVEGRWVDVLEGGCRHCALRSGSSSGNV